VGGGGGGGAPPQAILEYLDRANLFLIPLDNRREWFRYHALFASLLRQAWVAAADAAVVRQAQRRASQWFAAHGFTADAIRHALTGGDNEQAAALIEQNAWALIERGELVTLANWLAAVERLAPTRPWLSIYRGWERVNAGQLEAAEIFLQQAEAHIIAQTGLPADEARAMLGHIAAIRAYAAIPLHDAPRVGDLAHRALDLLPASELAVRGLATFATGAACWLRGDITCGKEAFADAGRLSRAVGNLYTATMSLRTLAYLETVSGHLYRAAEMFQEILQLTRARSGQPLPLAAEALLGLGALEYEWNHLDEAARCLEQAAELSQLLAAADTIVGSLVAQARLQRARGDAHAAARLLRQAESIGGESTLAPTYAAAFGAWRLLMRLERGDLRSAARLADELGLTHDRAGDWVRESEYLAFGRVLLAQGETDQTLALVTRRLPNAEATERWGHVIEMLILQALALKAQGHLPQALAALERALALAQPEGYVRLFLDEGAPMLELLRHAGSKGIQPQYVSRLLSERDQIAPAVAAAQQPLIEPLSERELEVLRLIADGKSNQEIADALVLAIGTVKRHVSNIFLKLNVESRTQCLARARELHLL
jgi:LuxR family maltose regulon positive regulatory protein